MAAEDYIDFGHMHSDDVPNFFTIPERRRIEPSSIHVSDAPNHGKVWTPTDNQVLRNAVRKGLAWTETARRLGRTDQACRLQAERLGLFNPNQPATIVQSKELNVNHMHLITLLQEGYTTCQVVLEQYDSYTQSDKTKSYTYKMPKDCGIAEGDRVVVYASEQLKVGRVAAVHDEPQIDFKAPYALKWIVQKVDLAAYDEQVAKEAAALTHLTAVQRKKDQERMLADLFGGQEGLDQLKKLING